MQSNVKIWEKTGKSRSRKIMRTNGDREQANVLSNEKIELEVLTEIKEDKDTS